MNESIDNVLEKIKSKFSLMDHGENDYDNDEGRWEIDEYPLLSVWEPDEEVDSTQVTMLVLEEDIMDPEEWGYFKLSDLKWFINLLGNDFYTIDNGYFGEELIEYVRKHGFLKEEE